MPATTKLAAIVGSVAAVSATAFYSTKQKSDSSAQVIGQENAMIARLQKPKLPSEFLHFKIGGYEISNA